MNNKLVCPFCQTELEDAGIHSAELYFWCTNCYMKQKEKDDNYTASPRIWQALIQAKQDLEIATKALEYYADSRFGKKRDDGTYALEIDKGCGVIVVYIYDPRPAKNALEQIEHKE